MNALFHRTGFTLVYFWIVFQSLTLAANERIVDLSENDFPKQLYRSISCNSFLNACYLRLNNGAHVLFRNQKQSKVYCSLSIPLKGNNVAVFDQTNLDFTASSYLMDKFAFHLKDKFSEQEISEVDSMFQGIEPYRKANISFQVSKGIIVDVLKTVKVPLESQELTKRYSTSMFANKQGKLSEVMKYDELLVANEVMNIEYRFIPFTLEEAEKRVVTRVVNNSLDPGNLFWEFSGRIKNKQLLELIINVLVSIEPAMNSDDKKRVYWKEKQTRSKTMYKSKSRLDIHLAYVNYSVPISFDLFNAVDFVSWMLEKEIRTEMDSKENFKNIKLKRVLNTDGVLYFAFYKVPKHNSDYVGIIEKANEKIKAYGQALLDEKKKEFMFEKWSDFKLNYSLNKRYYYVNLILRGLSYDHEFQQFSNITKYVTPKNVKRTLNEIFIPQYELIMKPH